MSWNSKIDYNRVVEILKIGRERIETKWIKGAFKEGGNYCAIGAVRFDLPDYLCKERCTAQMHLREVTPRKVQLEYYNDSSRTKKEDILKIYDDALAVAQEMCQGEPVVEIETTSLDMPEREMELA